MLLRQFKKNRPYDKFFSLL